MSRRGIGLLAALAVAGMANGSGTASVAAEPATTPPLPAKPLMLVVGPLAPLTINGIRFKAFERVTLTLYGSQRVIKHVTATRTGAFSAKFEIKVPPCRTVTIRAVGSKGSRAVRQLPRPNCREP